MKYLFSTWKKHSLFCLLRYERKICIFCWVMFCYCLPYNFFFVHRMTSFLKDASSTCTKFLFLTTKNVLSHSFNKQHPVVCVSKDLDRWCDTTPVDRIKSPQSGCPKPIVSYSNKVTEWILAPDVKVYRFPRQPRNVVEAVRNINGGIWPLHLQARGGLKTNLLNG